MWTLLGEISWVTTRPYNFRLKFAIISTNGIY
jgi:hypothetical protein